MTASASSPSATEPIRGQTRLLLWVLVIIAVLHLIAQLAVHNDRMLLPHLMAKWKETNGMYTDNRFYDDFDGTLGILYDQLPFADYSKGGVYFIGSSRLGFPLTLWDLPPQEQSLIHNYTIGASSYAQQWQFVRYLIEEHGLLKAGGEKTLVVIDLFIANANHNLTLQEGAPPGLWNYRFTGYGLYTYDREKGIGDVPMSQAKRFLRIAQVHDDNFWSWLFNLVRQKPSGGVMLQENLRRHPEEWMPSMTRVLGPDWENGMDLELRKLGEMIDYLQARKVHVVGIYMPQGTWYKRYPQSFRFRECAFALLQSKSVPYVDLAESMPDDRFRDSMHLNYVGVHEVFPKLLAIAEDFLHSSGALPRD